MEIQFWQVYTAFVGNLLYRVSHNMIPCAVFVLCLMVHSLTHWVAYTRPEKNVSTCNSVVAIYFLAEILLCGSLVAST